MISLSAIPPPPRIRCRAASQKKRAPGNLAREQSPRANEATKAKNQDGITIATIYVQPPTGVDSCGSSCYPAGDYLRDKIASPGQASEYSWDNIEQSVGNLADQILAKLC